MKKIIFILFLMTFWFLYWQQTGMCSPKEEIIVLGIRLGSAGHMFTTKITDVINMNVPEVSATVMTGSSEENPLNVQKKRAVIGFTHSHFAKLAFNGEGNYKGMPCKDIRHFFFFVITLDNFLVRADSNIKKIEELKDKKLCLGPKGYSLTDVALATLQAYGLTPEIIRKNGGNVSFALDQDCAQMLQDKVVDAMFAHTGKSAVISQVLPVEQAVRLRPLPFDRDKAQKVIETRGSGTIMEIDGGVYKAEPNPVLSIGDPSAFIIHKDVPDDIVYKMTKSIFEHQKEILKAVGLFFNPFKIENALVGAEILVHPGALKYYKEVGVTK